MCLHGKSSWIAERKGAELGSKTTSSALHHTQFVMYSEANFKFGESEILKSRSLS
jgi:hypothetical protein